MEFEPFAEVSISSLLKVCSSTKKIVVSAAFDCAKEIIEKSQFVRSLHQLSLALQEKNQQLRMKAIELLLFVVQKIEDVCKSKKYADNLIECMKRSLGDANKEVRQVSREIYGVIKERNFNIAMGIYDSLDPTTRKQVDQSSQDGPEKHSRNSFRAFRESLSSSTSLKVNENVDQIAFCHFEVETSNQSIEKKEASTEDAVVIEDADYNLNHESLDDLASQNDEASFLENPSVELDLDLLPLSNSLIESEKAFQFLNQFLQISPAGHLENGRIFEVLTMYSAQEYNSKFVKSLFEKVLAMIPICNLQMDFNQIKMCFNCLVTQSKVYWENGEILDLIANIWSQIQQKVDEKLYLRSLCELAKDDEANIFLRDCIMSAKVSFQEQSLDESVDLVVKEISMKSQIDNSEDESDCHNSLEEKQPQEDPFTISAIPATPKKQVHFAYSLKKSVGSKKSVKTDVFLTPKTPFPNWKFDQILLELETCCADLRAFQKIMKILAPGSDLASEDFIYELIGNLLTFLKSNDISADQREMAVIGLKFAIKNQISSFNGRFSSTLNAFFTILDVCSYAVNFLFISSLAKK